MKAILITYLVSKTIDFGLSIIVSKRAGRLGYSNLKAQKRFFWEDNNKSKINKMIFEEAIMLIPYLNVALTALGVSYLAHRSNKIGFDGLVKELSEKRRFIKYGRVANLIEEKLQTKKDMTDAMICEGATQQRIAEEFKSIYREDKTLKKVSWVSNSRITKAKAKDIVYGRGDDEELSYVELGKLLYETQEGIKQEFDTEKSPLEYVKSLARQ